MPDSIPLSRSADAFYSLKMIQPSATNNISPRRNGSLLKLGSLSTRHDDTMTIPKPLLATQAVRVQLYVRCETMWGDSVVLCGDSAQLGSWQAHRSSVVLTTDKNSYPVWHATCELDMPRTGGSLAFKVCIVRGSSHPELGAQVVEWEPLGDNRRLAPNPHHSSKAAHMGLVWGEPGASLQWRWEW